jgi:hypothetical protein
MTYRITWRHMSEDSSLQSYNRENLVTSNLGLGDEYFISSALDNVAEFILSRKRNFSAVCSVFINFLLPSYSMFLINKSGKIYLYIHIFQVLSLRILSTRL